jgi:hypothetical protein
MTLISLATPHLAREYRLLMRFQISYKLLKIGDNDYTLLGRGVGYLGLMLHNTTIILSQLFNLNRMFQNNVILP